MSRKLFIFDCFGVVVSDVSTLWMDKYGFTAEQTEFMRKDVFRNVDVGAIPLSQMFDIVAERFGLDKAQTIEEWRKLEYPLTDTLSVIEQLRNHGHTVALLSNADVTYVDYLFDKFDLRKYFDYLFVSSSYGCAKPDKEFYELCLKSIPERFDEVYFTDDNPNNLVGLQQLGIAPVLFKSARDFAQKVGLKEEI